MCSAQGIPRREFTTRICSCLRAVIINTSGGLENGLNVEVSREKAAAATCISVQKAGTSRKSCNQMISRGVTGLGHAPTPIAYCNQSEL